MSWFSGDGQDWTQKLRNSVTQVTAATERLLDRADAAAVDGMNRVANFAQKIEEKIEEADVSRHMQETMTALAHHGETAARASREAFEKGVSVLGLVDEDGAASDLQEVFLLDARSLQQIAGSEGEARSLVAQATLVFQRWFAHLESKGATTGHQEAVVEALVRSCALLTVLSTLAGTKEGRRLLTKTADGLEAEEAQREAEKAVDKATRSAEGGSDVADSSSGAVTQSEAPAAGGYPNSSQEEAQPAGSKKAPAIPPGVRLLITLLTKVSRASHGLLARLLKTLVAAAESDDARGTPPSEQASAGSAAEDRDMESAVVLLSAVLRRNNEASCRSGRAADFQTASDVVAAIQANIAARARAAPCGLTDPQAGQEVWAEFPTNGRWYRAKIKSLDADVLEVEWLAPPDDVECGKDLEYLPVAVRSSAAVPSAVPKNLIAGASEPRPAPAACDQVAWQECLRNADALGRAFRKLQQLCKELAPTPSPSTVPANQGSQVAAEVAADLEKVSTALDGMRQRCIDAGAAPVAPAIKSDEEFASRIRTVQEDLEALEQKLSAVRAKSSLLVDPAQVAAAESEQLLLVERQSDLKDKLETLKKAKANASEEKEGSAAATAAAAVPESQGANTRAAVLHEMRAICVVVAAMVVERRRHVEDLLSTDRWLLAEGRTEELAAKCIEAERLRQRLLEELLSGLHAALYGPDAATIGAEKSRVEEIRGLQNKACAVVESAWKDAVQLAAETLGDGGALGEVGARSSEELSGAAKRYKEMAKEMIENATRLNRLDTSISS
eukprot:TRINITY_DN36852_c0_g1_i1.p1 TRINITY_DN36852_c0_g1~~TRINITY_DN36852_c0_g1_i1.p1  ORF type:complete len:787 (-),score=220.04 TRINITY_DN36852_c0_g1_i1:24-2384(-)